MSGSARLTLEEWLQERHDNCLRHASDKTGFDREGWLEDADYFKQALTACMSIEPYAKRCDRFSAGLERIMEICQTERAPYQLQIFEIAEDALIEPGS